MPQNLSFIFHRIKQLSDKSIIACADWGFIHFSIKNEIVFYTSPAKVDQLKNFFPRAKLVPLPEAALNEYGDFTYASDVLEAEGEAIWFALTVQMEIGKLLKINKSDIERH